MQLNAENTTSQYESAVDSTLMGEVIETNVNTVNNYPSTVTNKF